jgi:nucleoside-diphosphate-sugar epimerase
MNILLIGGSGFIGTALVRELLKSGHEVRIFDKEPSNEFGERVILGDVRDVSALTAALKGVDAVYNLAAEHRDDVRPKRLYYDVNVQGARNIVQAAEANRVQKIVFTSTVAVYGLDEPEPDENSHPKPFNEYGKSKLEAESVFSVIVRPVVIFGENNRGNVYNLIRQIAGGKFIMVGSGKNKKSMGYVGNLVQFLLSALQHNPGKHIFNYADKPDMTVSGLVEYTRRAIGKTNRLLRLPYAIGLAGGYLCDFCSYITNRRYNISSIRIKKFCANTTVSTRALERSGFKAPYSIPEGLSRMMKNMKL